MRLTWFVLLDASLQWHLRLAGVLMPLFRMHRPSAVTGSTVLLTQMADPVCYMCGSSLSQYQEPAAYLPFGEAAKQERKQVRGYGVRTTCMPIAQLSTASQPGWVDCIAASDRDVHCGCAGCSQCGRRVPP